MKRFAMVFALAALGAGCLSRPASWPAPTVQPATPVFSEPSSGQAIATPTSTATPSPAAPSPTTTPAPAAQTKPPAPTKPKTVVSPTQPANGYVTIKNLKFGPQILAVSVGATVYWTNKDGVNHTVDSDAVRIFNSGNLPPGATFQHTFKSPGTYAYHCSVHPGMTGTIVVK